MVSHKVKTLFVIALTTACLSLAGDAWVVRMDGIGPVKIGMNLSELNAVLHEKFSMPKNKDDQGCFYVNPTNHPQVSLMIENSHVTRVDVDDPGISTAEGVQVGDSEEQARKVYGSKMKVAPSAYGGPGDHYLTVRSDNGKYGIRFETESSKIKVFYSGTFQAIQYVEGCE